MRLALLSCLGLALVAAVNRPMWCVPGECKIDSNCVDSIHGTSGRCCGGKCVDPDTINSRARLIGERCAPLEATAHPDDYEQCFAKCSDGLFCNTVDEVCHAKHGANCPCLADRECISGHCRTSHFCEGTNLPFGETCGRDGECASGVCTNNTCSARAIGEYCSSSFECVPGAICRRNTTFGFDYCLSPCAVGEASCCFDGSFTCATTPANLQCNTANYSCYVPVYPGLDEPCSYSLGCGNSSRTCALSCNATGCDEFPPVCQLRNQVEVGLECDSSAFGQCVAGAFCSFVGGTVGYACEVPLTNAPTGAPTSAPTGSPTPRAVNSIPLGQVCGSSWGYYEMNYDLCQAPGNMCELNQTGYPVCKQSGTTPIGAFCSLSWTNIHVRALDECVKGSRCTKNATSGSASYCAALIPVGERCYATGSRDYDYPECENGWDNCARSVSPYCYSCSGNDEHGKPCCTCVVPRTVPDSKNCSASKQCQVTSVCMSENYTCGNMQGVDCNSPSQCRDTSRFDCSCDRKCYLLNAPTPSQTSWAPTASTRAPSPYTPRCEAQRKAWAQTNISSSPWTYFPYSLDHEIFHDNFVPRLRTLTEEVQATMIAYVCCENCGSNVRFNSLIENGYQVDCGAKKLIKLEDTCNDLRGTWAMANCWGAVSAASTLDMGLGFLVATSLLFLY